MADDINGLEFAKIELERKRLDLEQLQSWLKVLAVIGACFTFGFSVWCYFDKRKSEFEVRKIEASQPFLKRQLALFEEATQITALIASSESPGDEKEKTMRFWQLYYGELALVEQGEVQKAMVKYGELLDSENYGDALEEAALSVAWACREELAKSWKVDYWHLEKLKREHLPPKHLRAPLVPQSQK
jgi:hypothetical protein